MSQMRLLYTSSRIFRMKSIWIFQFFHSIFFPLIAVLYISLHVSEYEAVCAMETSPKYTNLNGHYTHSPINRTAMSEKRREWTNWNIQIRSIWIFDREICLKAEYSARRVFHTHLRHSDRNWKCVIIQAEIGSIRK